MSNLYRKAFHDTSFIRVKDRMGVKIDPNWDEIFSFDISSVNFIECLGCGAYAEVWLCKIKDSEDVVALKIEGISPEAGELQGLFIIFLLLFYSILF